MTYFRAPRMSLAVQQLQMRAVWPELDTRVERGVLVVRGFVRPTAVTRRYKIRLTYRLERAPQLFVVDPRLERRCEQPDAPIPHTYNQNTPGSEEPCVYYPYSREWAPTMSLATTIMPWLLTWLVDYEVWQATGQWLGGGVPHGSTKRPNHPRSVGADAA